MPGSQGAEPPREVQAEAPVLRWRNMGLGVWELGFGSQFCHFLMTWTCIVLLWPELHCAHFLVNRHYAQAIVGEHQDSLYLNMNTSYIGRGVSQAMHHRWKHCFLNSCSFNSFHYLGCDLGLWVVVYGAYPNSGSLFRLLFTKQVWTSQRRGEVKLFPPVIRSSVEELGSRRTCLRLERILTLDIFICPSVFLPSFLLRRLCHWTWLAGPFLGLGRRCRYCPGNNCDIVQCSAHL